MTDCINSYLPVNEALLWLNILVVSSGYMVQISLLSKFPESVPKTEIPESVLDKMEQDG